MENIVTVSSPKIISWQSCKRKFLLENEWRALKWSHRVLFNSCLRQALYELSNGKSVEDCTSEARTRFMNIGASPGMELPYGADPYTYALDYTAMMSTIIEAVSRRGIMRLNDIPSVMISNDIEWIFTCHAEDSGVLHRIVICDSWDDDRATQEIHSWLSFGDQVVAKSPLNLTVIEIGQIRNGRREHPWVRAFQHSRIRGKIKFTKKGGKELEGDWNKIYLSNVDSYDARSWCDRLEEDGILNTLIHNVEIDEVKQQHVHEGLRQIKTEAEQMKTWTEQVENPRLVPMSRQSCDSPYPCPFRAVCYSPDVTMDIDGLGLYKRKLPIVS